MKHFDNDRDTIDGIVRCFADPMYDLATFAEIASATESTAWAVKRVWEGLRMRKHLGHAKMISQQLKMGMDSEPSAVITIALEHLMKTWEKDVVVATSAPQLRR